MRIVETSRKAWAILLPSERRQAKLLAVILLVAAAATALMVSSILPFLVVLGDAKSIRTNPFLSRIYDLFGFSSVYGFVLALGLGALCIIILASIMQIARAYGIAVFSAARVESISNRLLEGYLRQPYEFFLNHHSGDLGNKILTEAQQVDEHFYKPAAEIMAATASSVAIIGLVLWYSPVLAIASILTLGALYGLTYLFTNRHLSRLAKQRLEANRARFRLSIDSLTGIKEIRILGRESTYLNRFRDSSHVVARSISQSGMVAEIPNYVLQALAFGGIIALGLFVLEPSEIGEPIALETVLPSIGLFAFAGQRLLPEVQRVYAGLTRMQYAHVVVDAIHRDLVLGRLEQQIRIDRPEPLRLLRTLTLSHAAYRYDTERAGGLDDVSLDISVGEKIGIVGTSGAGKSTLANLLLGLILPQSGAIHVDGVKIDTETVRAWQRSVGYVPQDIFLIDGSLRENIALGQLASEIDEQRVIAACQAAQLEPFIQTELDQGLDTTVGERGQKLSGGQRQRIGIARAIFNNSDFLVFDEATSALDTVTEREVMSAIDALPNETTIVIIAHRLATIRGCDRIVVMDKGRIVASGNWDRLLAESDVFRQLATGPGHNSD